MFVGVGASRVRDLFEQAKQSSPCIIFMDEIDAVSRHRGAGLGGGHDEREQTLNQLLVEMDGFEMKDNIILIAATNRPDILDPALRSAPAASTARSSSTGPTGSGARRSSKCTRRANRSRQIDLDTLAAGTPGFTGADLANLINEAALLAARHGKKMIGQDELEEGIMRVIAGPEKKARLLSEKERKITAYHEMGHALVGHFLEGTNPVNKITIVSRGQALGLAISLPTEDRYLTTRSALMDDLAMTLGGRAAEELVFHEVTTGAANDLEKVTATSKAMIMRYGMSEKLGPRVLGRDHSQPFLGREMGNEPDYSDEIAREIDDEIRRVIEEAHATAHRVLREHMDHLHKLSAILIERETIDKDQFERLLAGEAEESVFPEEVAEAAGHRPRARRTGSRSRSRSRAQCLVSRCSRCRPDPAGLVHVCSGRVGSGPDTSPSFGAARRDRQEEQRHRCNRGRRAERVDAGAARAEPLDEGKDCGAARERRDHQPCDERDTSKVHPRLVRERSAKLERPVGELGGAEEQGGEERRADVSSISSVKIATYGSTSASTARGIGNERRRQHCAGGHVAETSVAKRVQRTRYASSATTASQRPAVAASATLGAGSG